VDVVLPSNTTLSQVAPMTCVCAVVAVATIAPVVFVSVEFGLMPFVTGIAQYPFRDVTETTKGHLLIGRPIWVATSFTITFILVATAGVFQ